MRSAQACYDPSGRAALSQALQFAGLHGRIATLPEIITARSQVPLDHSLWTQYFTTASLEAFGYSRGGVPIVIVSHTLTLTVDTLEKMYRRPLEGLNERRLDGGQGFMPVELFRELESGELGDAEIVDLSTVEWPYPYPLLSAATVDQAAADPLLQARLGPDWEATLVKVAEQTVREELRFTGASPKVVYSQENLNASYLNWKPDLLWPMAHLLSVTQLMHMHASGEDGGQFFSFEVSPHGRNHGTRFVGVRQNGNVIDA